MAEPVGRGLRAARRRGLTSPEAVRIPTAQAATPKPRPRPRNPRTSRTTVSGGKNTPENHPWKR